MAVVTAICRDPKAPRESVVDSKGVGELSGIKLDTIPLVCDAREDYVAVAVHQAYISSVATELKKTATTAKIDGLTSAVLTLFKTYSVDVTSTPQKLKAAQTLALNNCKKDFSVYADSYYNYAFRPAPVGFEDILSPFSSLVKLVIDIITPVAEAGAKLVDDAKRKAAIQKYLEKREVREQIIKSAKRINAELSSTLNSRRYQQLGEFVDQAVALSDVKFDLTKETSCKAAFNGDNLIIVNDRPSDHFVKCMTAVSATYTDKIAALLLAADDYDRLADAPPDLTGSKLAAITQQLDNNCLRHCSSGHGQGNLG